MRPDRRRPDNAQYRRRRSRCQAVRGVGRQLLNGGARTSDRALSRGTPRGFQPCGGAVRRLASQRERLRTVAISALEKLIARHIAGNKPGACIPAATRLLGLEPLREDVHRTLMRA
ncbi:BTAD domain-containing putative transcriptional regulator [Rhizobium etli]|uniref:BTAD domain-containing putative transcriptional regulator n=1 Tax=Rhizobium etli TaxID=29449 RepID=UPI0009B82326